VVLTGVIRRRPILWASRGEVVGDVVELFGGPVARLYRRSLTDQGFEVLMVAVFDIAALQGYAVARGIVKELAGVPNIPLAEAWLRVLRHLGPTALKEFLAPEEEARWKRAVEIKMGEAKEQELPAEVAWSLLAQVLAESRSSAADTNLRPGCACSKDDTQASRQTGAAGSNERNSVEPHEEQCSGHIFVGSKAPWDEICGSAPGFQKEYVSEHKPVARTAPPGSLTDETAFPASPATDVCVPTPLAFSENWATHR
jgi:hypothetical protein